MKFKKWSMAKMIRHLIQTAAFFAFPGLFISVLSAGRDIVKALTSGNFSLRDLSAQIIIFFGVMLITALWGRFFCGYLCTFGTFQELVGGFSHRILKNRKEIPPGADRGLKLVKHAVLVIIVMVSWILALPVDSSLDPWGVFGMLISGSFSVASRAVTTGGFLLLIFIMAGAFFVDRFFCRYLCPLGSLFVLVSGKRLYKIRRKEERCTHCGLCEKQCCMGVDILRDHVIGSRECIDCMSCVDVCSFGSLYSHPGPAVAGTAAAATICGLVTVGNLSVPSAKASGEYVAQEGERGEYKDGIYTGSGVGFRGETRVQVTVENGFISDVTVLSYEDDRDFFQKAEARVTGDIIAAQSVDVGIVSGATFSSRGIIEAVADALNIGYENENEDQRMQEGHGHGGHKGGGGGRHR